MLSSDTRAMGCFVDVVWYDLNVTPERVGDIPTLNSKHWFLNFEEAWKKKLFSVLFLFHLIVQARPCSAQGALY